MTRYPIPQINPNLLMGCHPLGLHLQVGHHLFVFGKGNHGRCLPRDRRVGQNAVVICHCSVLPERIKINIFIIFDDYDATDNLITYWYKGQGSPFRDKTRSYNQDKCYEKTQHLSDHEYRPRLGSNSPCHRESFCMMHK